MAGAFQKQLLRLVCLALLCVLGSLYAASGNAQEVPGPIQNSIFVFRTGGLCLVHLGNLRHPLTPHQLQRLGRPDVVMIPADGAWTISFADVLTIIDQLRPSLIIPMHIDTPQQALTFVQHTGRRYAVRQVSERSLTLSRQLLPAAATIVLFGGA
jgi:L-ascorbate metabolism protein UlaG (beta-lactamase superfamily)